MSKFRDNKTKINVNGKLPVMAYFPTLRRFAGLLSRTSYNFGEEDASVDAFTTYMDNIQHKEENSTIAIAKSNSKVVKVNGDVLVLPTAFLTEVISNGCYSYLNPNASKRKTKDDCIDYENESFVASTGMIATKILDLVRHAYECDGDIFEINISSEMASKTTRAITSGYYGVDWNPVAFPYLSSRYEPSMFKAECEVRYADCERQFDQQGCSFENWSKDLELFKKTGLPVCVTYTEAELIKKEFLS